MEGRPSIESKEEDMLKKHGMLAGRKVVFEKTVMNSDSKVSLGSRMSGVLDADIKIGSPIYLDNRNSTISNVRSVEERKGDLYIISSTSEYKLVYDFEDIGAVETAQGSVYRYLEDGTTQRYKKVENKDYNPQSYLVYIPGLEFLKNNYSSVRLDKIGENQSHYIGTLLSYIHGKGKKCYVINKEGKKLESNKEILNEKEGVYLTFGDENEVDFYIPVSPLPKIGFNTYDSRKYKDEKTGGWMREFHIGNEVTKIFRKGEKS